MDEALRALAEFYGPIAPPPRELFAFFVWDVISSRTLSARRDHAWQALKRIPALTPDAMFHAPKDELKAALEMVGNVDARMNALREGSGHFRRHRDLADTVAGPIKGALRALQDVPHLSMSARMTAPLLVAGRAVPAVDDGTARVLVRIAGLSASTEQQRRRAARRALVSAFGRNAERLARAVVVLGHHAQHACGEHAPHCPVCPLRADCRYSSRSSS
jgi:endonuclease III